MKRAEEQVVGNRQALIDEAITSLVEFLTEKVIPTRAFLGEKKALIRSFKGGVVKRDGEDFTIQFTPEEAKEYRSRSMVMFKELGYELEDYEDIMSDITDGAVIKW